MIEYPAALLSTGRARLGELRRAVRAYMLGTQSALDLTCAPMSGQLSFSEMATRLSHGPTVDLWRFTRLVRETRASMGREAYIVRSRDLARLLMLRPYGPLVLSVNECMVRTSTQMLAELLKAHLLHWSDLAETGDVSVGLGSNVPFYRADGYSVPYAVASLLGGSPTTVTADAHAFRAAVRASVDILEDPDGSRARLLRTLRDRDVLTPSFRSALEDASDDEIDSVAWQATTLTEDVFSNARRVRYGF